MEPIAVLPVFFKLAGKRAVLAGGGEPAVWKAELLAAAGAMVDLFATEPCPALLDLLADPPGAGTLTLIPRAWAPDDLIGAAIAIGAIEEPEEAEAFRVAAHAAGIPVNVIDKPAYCDFQFGTIVSRSPLVIGIFDGRRGTRLRPGDPRPYRGAAAAGVEGLGRGGTGLAACGASAGSRLPRAPSVLGNLHRPGDGRAAIARRGTTTSTPVGPVF